MIADSFRRPPPPGQRPLHDDRTDAIRYAVLQRIAPALRHDMVVHMQPIGMIHEVMEHRLAHLSEDVHTLHESAARMSRFAKAALSSCTASMTWFERDPEAMTPVSEAVGDIVAMLGRTFGFMGFELINEVGDCDCRVPRDAIRHTLSAALLAAADTAACPSDVFLSSRTVGEHDLALVLLVVEQPGKRARQAFQESYRRLDWDDVEAVASAESAGFARHGEGVTLFFPV